MGPWGISNANVFAALESLRRKKKSDKEHGSSKRKGSSKNQAKEPEPQVYWTPAPLTVKSRADVDDDDDDYYATTAPPSAWGSTLPQQRIVQLPLRIDENMDDTLANVEGHKQRCSVLHCLVVHNIINYDCVRGTSSVAQVPQQYLIQPVADD